MTPSNVFFYPNNSPQAKYIEFTVVEEEKPLLPQTGDAGNREF